MDAVDAMPRELRECVHEFGMPIVNTCVRYGVKSPVAIRTMVKEIWAGARQLGQGGTAYDTLEWVLQQAGAHVSSKTIHRLLAENNLCVVGISPSRAMLNASMNEVSNGSIRCTKEEKHRRRLSAAIKAAMKQNCGSDA